MSTLQGVPELIEPALHEGSRPNPAKLVLCVDLDGTLIKTDLFLESILVLLKQRPWAIFLILCWGLRGRSFLKRRLATAAPLAAEKLPYRQEVLEFVRAERESGRPTLLVTAADQTMAEAIASHLGQFDGVYVSDAQRQDCWPVC